MTTQGDRAPKGRQRSLNRTVVTNSLSPFRGSLDSTNHYPGIAKGIDILEAPFFQSAERTSAESLGREPQDRVRRSCRAREAGGSRIISTNVKRYGYHPLRGFN